VQNHFLSREVDRDEPAQGPSSRARRPWLADREHARQVSRQFAVPGENAGRTSPNELQDLVSQVVRNRVRSFRVAPDRQDSGARVGDTRQESCSTPRETAAEAVRNNRDLIRERVRAETAVVGASGSYDRTRSIRKSSAAVETVVAGHGDGSRASAAHAFDDAIRDFIERLQHSPEVIARAEALKEEWLMGAQTDELAPNCGRESGAVASTRPYRRGDLSKPARQRLERVRDCLLSNPTLLATSTICLIDVTANVVEKYRTRSAT